MTTAGYGNLVPAANPGQTFAVLEAVTGQLFLVVAVGKIISSMPRRGERPSPGRAGPCRSAIASGWRVLRPGIERP